MSSHKDGDITQIPINTRAVGQPQGSYLLYLEDYVHTFIRKLYQERTSDADKQIISLYGYGFEEDGRNYLIVSGAIDKGALEVSGERFFPSCYCIGEASIIEGRDTQIALEIELVNGKKLLIDNFYIYYDQNEEMQNYLIEWNLTHHNRGKLRKESDDAVRFTRLTQGCNREEARVNYLWNTMNLLSLGLMVCVLAFGIISFNNYQKMKSMEDKLAYIMSFPSEALAAMSEQVALAEKTPQSEADESWQADVEKLSDEESEAEWQTQADNQQSANNQSGTEAQMESQLQSNNQSQTSNETQPENQQQTNNQSQPAQEVISSVSEDTTAQYYIVQPGDTLRTISYQIYGDYSMVDKICAWNHIDDADSILYGQKLLLHQE